MNGEIDFLGIGAAKSGTTWLYARFDELSDFSLPPKKEFHYFDRDKIYHDINYYPTINELGETFFLKRLKNKHFINRSIFNLFQSLRIGDINNFRWLLKWYYSNYNDEWYLSMFKSFHGITGEITPSYGILNNKDYVKLYNLLPNVKIIFLIRNPIERAWSSYRFSLNFIDKNEKKHDWNNIDKIKSFLESENQQRASNYIATIDQFEKYHNKGQFLLGFYDAIIDQPNTLKECNLKAKNNVSKKIRMPLEVEKYLKNRYEPMMEELSDRYGGYCKKWYDSLGVNGEEIRDQRTVNNYSSCLVL